MAKRFFLNTAALTGARLVSVISQIVILPIIAKYLTVEDFGAVALAMTVVVFAQLLSDAGVGRSLIRQKEVIHQEWNTVFWFLGAVGVALTLILWFAAPYAGRLFDSDIVGSLIAALAVVPLLYALTAVFSARMEKDKAFPQLAIIQLLSAVAGMAAAIWLAIAGAGAWALVAQQIAISVVRLGLTMIFSNFRCGWPRQFVNIRNHLLFGRDSIGVAFVYTAQRQVPVMLIGYVLGQASLGLYAMSHRILSVPQMAVGAPFAQVAYIRMTELQDKPGGMADVYIMTVRVMAFAIFPPMLILAAVAPDIFATILSEPWRDAGTIYALAAFGIALETTTSNAGVMLQAADKSTVRLKMATERTVLRLLAIGAALPFGIYAVSFAISVFASLYLWRFLQYARQADTFQTRNVVTALAPAVGVSICSMIGFYVYNQTQGDVGGLDRIMQAAAVLVVTWVIVLALQFKELKRGLKILG